MAWNGLIKYVSRKRMFWMSIVHGMEWVDKEGKQKGDVLGEYCTWHGMG